MGRRSERDETKRVKIKEGRSLNEVKSKEGVKERWSGGQQETAEWETVLRLARQASQDS